ncbi:MAG: nucleotide exchange factor GrpE [Patescibacteria group bacterium]
MSEELENLQEELDAATVALEAARKEAADNLDGWKRAKADFSNREKDLAREKSEYLKFANARLLLEMLAIYESFAQAVETQCLASPQDGVVETQNFASLPDNVSNGFLGIKKQFEDLLKKYGLEKIEALGAKFDYNLHEAVGTLSVPKTTLGVDGTEKIPRAPFSEGGENAESGEIIKEIQAGYMLHGEVLRPAKVIVAE